MHFKFVNFFFNIPSANESYPIIFKSSYHLGGIMILSPYSGGNDEIYSCSRRFTTYTTYDGSTLRLHVRLKLVRLKSESESKRVYQAC